MPAARRPGGRACPVGGLERGTRRVLPGGRPRDVRRCEPGGRRPTPRRSQATSCQQVSGFERTESFSSAEGNFIRTARPAVKGEASARVDARLTLVRVRGYYRAAITNFGRLHADAFHREARMWRYRSFADPRRGHPSSGAPESSSASRAFPGRGNSIRSAAAIAGGLGSTPASVPRPRHAGQPGPAVLSGIPLHTTLNSLVRQPVAVTIRHGATTSPEAEADRGHRQREP